MKASPRCQPSPVDRAFTLVEMLTVLAVIVVLATLVTPALTGVLKANDLTQGSQSLINQLSLARQQALTQNHPTEVRFYQFVDPAFPGESPADLSSGKYRAVQTFSVSEAGVVTPINKVERLPSTFIIDSGQKLSSIMAPTATVGVTTGPVVSLGPQTAADAYNVPVVGKNYNMVAFRFYPDGSTSLGAAPAGGWFITGHLVQYGDKVTNVPANFSTIQIDPSNGNLREFRP